MASKYQPLTDFLLAHAGQELRMSFSEIERIVDAPLPARSKANRAWWSNNPNNSVLTKAWLAAGFRTEKVDMAAEMLSFVPAEKTEGFSEMPQSSFASPKVSKAAVPGHQPRRHPAFGSLKGTSIVLPGVDLTAPVLDDAWERDYDALNAFWLPQGKPE